ncbi:hypothetical protein EV363DRAFT_1588655 [Boletus edulis]|nr:hypothetical protein EV363DRAFT_1588655 [Boletus edulis]
MIVEGDITPVEIDVRRSIRAITFSPNGEYLVSGDDEAVRVWRVDDGVEVRMMAVRNVRSIAVSKDGERIAAGTDLGRVIVWDAHTYDTIFTHKESGSSTIRGVDFSPDSTRLVTASGNCTVSIWDLAAGERVLGPLYHEQGVTVTKYSPEGDQIATCTGSGPIRVYHSRSGDLIKDIPINISAHCNVGLIWSNHGQYLLVVSDGQIKQIQVSTGSVVAGWPVHDYGGTTCIALSKRGNFIAYSSNRTVNFLDPSTGELQGHVIKHDQDVHSITISLDDRLLATIMDSKIMIRTLPDTVTSSSFNGPFMLVRDTVLDSWKQGQLVKTEGLLTEDIDKSTNLDHRALAYRALIRTRLQQLDVAHDDVEKSIKSQPSVIGFIARAIAFVSEGKMKEGYRACDLAFKHCHSDRVDILLAIKAYMNFLRGKFHMERGNYEDAIKSLKDAQTHPMRRHESRRLWTISLISGWQFNDLGITIQRHLCKALYETGRSRQAEDVLLSLVDSVTPVTNMSESMIEWISNFIGRCLSTPGNNGDATFEAERQEQATAPRRSMSPVGSLTRVRLLAEWVRIKLASSSWETVLVAAVCFTVPRVMVYRAICECLEAEDHLADVIECFHQIVKEPAIIREEEEWLLNFARRHGDAAMEAQQYDEAITWYSNALALNPTIRQAFLIKRSKAYLERGFPKEALDDADETIKLDPSCSFGYERKHAALQRARRYGDAIDAFEAMLSRMSASSDPEIRKRSCQYVKPREAEVKIRTVVQDAVRDLPRVLINTTSERLLNQSEQAALFESSPVFTELVSSMTTVIDDERIKHEVAQYYRYAAFSHTWEDNEPLFENVVRIAVYDLKKSPTHDKLQMFCNVARDAGFNWAWSDNCCINKQDHAAHQEAVVAMFKWYEGSSLVIVFLRGVRSPSKRGDLMRSLWNTRAWTFQEYHAAKVVQFYTEDWKPYLNLDIPNHKESPEVISEMEELTGISARTLRELHPGLDDIRQKLSLASGRKATYVEDTAYSLFGIFSVSLPVVYGERDKALGQLLAHLLASSGDMSILSWTGKSGSFNSCLPADITVFSQLHPPHIPLALTMETFGSSPNFDVATRLYDRLNDLPMPSLSGKRIKIPCIIFELGGPRRTSGHPNIFRANADALGIVEITTTSEEDLSRLDHIYVVHPWIGFLLSRHPVRGDENVLAEGGTADGSLLCASSPLPGHSTTSFMSQLMLTGSSRLLGARPAKPKHDMPSPRSSSTSVPLTGKQTQVLQFIARLRQPFGALLFAPTRHNVKLYRRIATDSMITVQIEQLSDAQWDDLIANVQMLDVL